MAYTIGTRNAILLLAIVLMIFFLLPKGYYNLYPSLIPTYPPNHIELQEVWKARTELNQNAELKQLFYRTDPSVVYAFYDEFNISLEKLINITSSVSVISLIYLLKYIHNRRRPSQLDSRIALDSKTADTPSYPSGHAYQAYLIARELSKERPELKEKLMKVADKCAYARVAAGLHYPSDSEYSKWLVFGNEV
jgi:hypothetical protein